MKRRPKLPPASEEMKQWSAMLQQELSGWPGVTSRPMFGLTSFYRNGAIFAALPHTRAVRTPNSLIIKFDPMPRKLLERAGKNPSLAGDGEAPGKRWYSFEINSADDLRDALWWLNHAYHAATR